MSVLVFLPKQLRGGREQQGKDVQPDFSGMPPLPSACPQRERGRGGLEHGERGSTFLESECLSLPLFSSPAVLLVSPGCFVLSRSLGEGVLAGAAWSVLWVP